MRILISSKRRKQLAVGLDIGVYPGDNIASWLLNNSNFSWIGFYFPTLAHQQGFRGHETSWMPPKAESSVCTFLKELGWGVVPIYAGQGINSSKLSGPQGTSDAVEAADFAQRAGFSPGTVIYLDIEGGAPTPRSLKDYYAAWVEEAFNQQFYPGLYCSASRVPDLQLVDTRPLLWVAKWIQPAPVLSPQQLSSIPAPDPNTACQGATIWQFTSECPIQTPFGPPISVDLDSSVSDDPSVYNGAF